MRPADQSPGVLLRLAAMVYEAVLLFGVLFIAGYAALALARWTYPLAPTQRTVLQALLFVVLGFYFVYCWSHTGQTLAMKSWRLRLVDADGHPPRWPRGLLRYLLAWSLFLPGLVVVALTRWSPLADLVALGAGIGLMLLLRYADPQRQLLHDRLLGLRVIRC
jgi:uncharacterized RDD family membrane protein YckC